MTIGTRKLASMQAQIGNGIRKQDSHLVTDTESSAAWDRLAAQLANIKRSNPSAVIDVVNDPDL